jgi:hypothetical protein
MTTTPAWELTVSELKIDPIDLALSADHMDMHGNDLQVAHTSANAALKGAAAGWVGMSAAALQARMADLQAVTDELHGQISTIGEQFRIASGMYSATDSDCSDALNGRSSAANAG